MASETHGLPKPRRLAGAKGEPGQKWKPGAKVYHFVDFVKSNWKQCVWNRLDTKDTGLTRLSGI